MLYIIMIIVLSIVVLYRAMVETLDIAISDVYTSVLDEDALIRWRLKSSTITTVGRKIHRDRAAVNAANMTCRKGSLPFLPNINGPNRAYRRAHDSALQSEGKERARALSLSLEQQREEERKALLLKEAEAARRRLEAMVRTEAYCASNTNRLRAQRRWEQKGTPQSSSIRRKAVVQATVFTSVDGLSRNEKGLTKAQVRAKNLLAVYSRAAKKRSRKEAKAWALIERSCYKAIVSGDNSPETMAIYRAARSAA